MFSITTSYVQSKLNRYSMIGSLLYGLFCVSCPTPEVIEVIGSVLYFLSAASFYFVMYIFYSENKELFTYMWSHKTRTLFMLIFGFFIVINSIILLYMLLHKVSYEYAGDMVASYVGQIFYYMPFLP